MHKLIKSVNYHTRRIEDAFRCIDAIDMDREAVRCNDDGTVTLVYEKETQA